MNIPAMMKSGAIPFAFLMSLAGPAAAAQAGPSPLAGTWALVAADVIHPDASRGQDYGAAPKGLWIIDHEGRYSLQIYSSERPRYASGDRATGTAAEYRAVALGVSAHIGTVSVDPAAQTFTLHIEGASFPNQEGSVQTRAYELKDGQLSYRVAARANGDVPVSVWRRVE
jgi:hypothetical protein